MALLISLLFPVWIYYGITTFSRRKAHSTYWNVRAVKYDCRDLDTSFWRFSRGTGLFSPIRKYGLYHATGLIQSPRVKFFILKYERSFFFLFVTIWIPFMFVFLAGNDAIFTNEPWGAQHEQWRYRKSSSAHACSRILFTRVQCAQTLRPRWVVHMDTEGIYQLAMVKKNWFSAN